MVVNLYKEFRNNVFSRHESNQIKADRLWIQINHLIPEYDRNQFKIEWCHYRIGELSVDRFSSYFTEYVSKYFMGV